MSKFTCPKCGAVSHNPNDATHGYCGRCHEFTGAKKPCALCGEFVELFVERPLGRDDAMVRVCLGCDEDHPRSGRYAFAEGARLPRAKRVGRGGLS